MVGWDTENPNAVRISKSVQKYGRSLIVILVSTLLSWSPSTLQSRKKLSRISVVTKKNTSGDAPSVTLLPEKTAVQHTVKQQIITCRNISRISQNLQNVRAGELPMAQIRKIIMSQKCPVLQYKKNRKECLHTQPLTFFRVCVASQKKGARKFYPSTPTPDYGVGYYASVNLWAHNWSKEGSLQNIRTWLINGQLLLIEIRHLPLILVEILPFSRIPWFFHDAGNPDL